MKTIVMTISRPATPPVYSGRANRVPDTGTFVQVRHDWEVISSTLIIRRLMSFMISKIFLVSKRHIALLKLIASWGGVPRGVTIYGLKYNSMTGKYEGMPEKNPYATFPDAVYMPGLKTQGDFMPMNEQVQNFWFDLMGLATDNTWGFPELSLAWLNVTQDGKAMTDDHSWSHNESNNTDKSKMFREWITGKNLTTNLKDMSIKSLHMGGNIAHVLGADNAGNWLIETLDFENLPDVEEAWAKPWLTPWLTQTAVNPVRAVDWPQLGPHGVPFPLVGLGGINKLPNTWAKPIAPGTEFSPYS